MGQACSSQEAQQMFIEDLNLPCTSVINSNEKHSINNCATVVSLFFFLAMLNFLRTL